MEKDGSLRIDKWQVGIGQSSALGFGQMVNVDIFSKPGFLKISHKLANDLGSVGIVDELIKWSVQNPDDGHTFHVDRNGKLYERDTGGNWTVITGHGTTGANGEGLAIWKDYLFYIRRTRIDVYGPLSAGPTWTNDWEAVTPGIPYDLESSFSYNLHPVMAAQDDYLYIGNAQYVDTLNEATPPFNPTNPASWTYNAQDLELRSDYRIVCLEPFGTDIVIGTIMGINSVLNVADMFFWDGTSDSFSLNKTIQFAENGIQMTKNANNILYTIAGRGTPRFFASATSQAQEIKRLNNIEVPITKKLRLYPDAIDQKDGEIMFGLGQSNGINGPNPLGVYSYRDSSYVLRHIISTGSDGSVDTMQIGSVKAISSERILVSWHDDANTPQYGVDVLSNNFYNNYSAYVESPIYTVGTEDDPTTFEKVQVILGKRLNTGDGVRIKARKSLDDPFTIVATFDTTTPNYVGRNSFDVKVGNIDKFVDFQARIELTTASNSTESPELKSVKFI